MTTDLLAPSLDDLIALLDPEREYGERTFEQVVEQVRAGDLILEVGHNLPVIRDRSTNHTVKGTGRPPVGNQGPQQTALAEFRRMALDDVPFAYQNLIKGMKSGDPRYDKIYWEQLIGKMGEVRGGGDEMFAFMRDIIEYARAKPDIRTVDVEASVG